MNPKTAGIIAVLVIVFAVFFWPTIYHYETIKTNNYEQLVRINRITGSTEYFLGGEWTAAKPKNNPNDISILPYEELKKLTGSAGLNRSSIVDYIAFGGNLYNGTTWQIKKLKIKLSPKDKNGNVLWERSFYAVGFDQINPLSYGKFEIPLSDVQEVATVDWTIEEAQGISQ